MPTPNDSATTRLTASQWVTGIALLIAGLGGHLVSAYIIRMNPLAFPDHIKGFFFIAALTGVIIYALSRFFWRGRPAITWFVFCGVQTLIGSLILVLTMLGHPKI